ncbi:MAG: PilW family protein [Rhodanobacteraceae bacterium]
MIRARHSILAHRRMAGLSLIEMMIALVMALIVAAGIITVFESTSSSNKVQAQMATLQEEGRFAIHSLRSDLANANGAYCSNTGGNAGLTSSKLYLDALHSPTMYATANLTDASVAGHFPDNTVSLVDPTGPYSLPSALFMRGYDCGATSASCTPVDPSAGTSIPPIGIVIGDRVPGTSVLTTRYLKPGSGWALVPPGSPNGSYIDLSIPAAPTVVLRQLPGEPAPSTFTGTFAMLADCSNAQVYAVAPNGSGFAVTAANYAMPRDISQGRAAAPRVFDFTNDFQTVTYYVKVVDAGNGYTTGELVRRVNGTDTPLVRGVERLNFRYGVIASDGTTQFLTADDVDKAKDATGTPIPCPPDVSLPGGMPDAGCLWRAVQTIQVNILMDGQTPLYTLTPAEMNYIYTPDGDSTPEPPTEASRAIQPSLQGFPDQLLRRQFTTVISLRNFNP